MRRVSDSSESSAKVRQGLRQKPHGNSRFSEFEEHGSRRTAGAPSPLVRWDGGCRTAYRNRNGMVLTSVEPIYTGILRMLQASLRLEHIYNLGASSRAAEWMLSSERGVETGFCRSGRPITSRCPAQPRCSAPVAYFASWLYDRSVISPSILIQIFTSHSDPVCLAGGMTVAFGDFGHS